MKSNKNRQWIQILYQKKEKRKRKERKIYKCPIGTKRVFSIISFKEVQNQAIMRYYPYPLKWLNLKQSKQNRRMTMLPLGPI